jgi:5-methylcytosine-specific restriction endonuclease McrA
MAVTRRNIGKFYRGRQWAEARGAALYRAGYACRICGRKSGGLHVHHRIPLTENWSLRLDPPNLEVLCGRHHKEAHRALKVNNKNVHPSRRLGLRARFLLHDPERPSDERARRKACAHLACQPRRSH